MSNNKPYARIVHAYKKEKKKRFKLDKIVQIVEENNQEPKSEDYYEDLIEGRVKPKTAREKVIQRWGKENPGRALAIIGLDDPAAKAVFKYLAEQEYEKTGPQETHARWMISLRTIKDRFPHA